VITVPDSVEVVADERAARTLERPPLLVVSAVDGYLDSIGVPGGVLAWQRIGDGQSNVTYLIERGGRSLVLRRGPRPPHPKSTHDMLREAKLQRVLGGAGVPVPTIVAVCTDESVLGVPFYLMEYIEGTIVTDRVPAQFDPPPERQALVAGAVSTLSSMHAIDVSDGDVATLGRPDGYLGRQVALFQSLWSQNTTRSLPEVERIGQWLAARMPTTQAHAIVHGDYRLGNLMFSPAAPVAVRAVLDWEMATLGDPLADLGYFVATYAAADRAPTVMELTPVTREPGFPSRDDVVTLYAARSTLDVSELAWYETLALWKSAVFCEAMYTRWLAGERPGDTFAPTLERGVPELLAAAGESMTSSR
jgi:aminoglycoside phosphotransferase (APT) family kinase protein